MRVQTINFFRNAQNISAFCLYMGGEIHKNGWDLSMNICMEGQGKYKQFGLQQQAHNSNINQILLRDKKGNNYEPKILTDLNIVRFPLLQILDLQGNNLNSIEVISHIHLPVLVRLDLAHNNITQIKPLSKMNNLEEISFKNNKLLSLDPLTLMKSKILKQIELQTYLTNQAQGQSLRFSIKLESECLTWLVATNKKRISTIRGIREKYEGITLRVREGRPENREERVRNYIIW